MKDKPEIHGTDFVELVAEILEELIEDQYPINYRNEPLPGKIQLTERWTFHKLEFRTSKGASGQIRLMYYALKSAPGILEILARNHIREGLVVDLGCGSGLWAQALVKANYQVLGVDISESMIEIARTRVPDAEFRVESLFKVDIPPCNAVTSIGECLNYLLDPNSDRKTLLELFHRIHRALIPGGVFIFDIAESGQVAQRTPTRGFTEGEDWVVLVEKEEDRERRTLTRGIITFRKVGEYYRRDDEVHHLRLYEATDVADELCQVGFQVEIMRSYGQYDLPPAHAAIVACKPV